MGSEPNRYSDLFADVKSSNEARTVLFSNCDGLSEEDLDALKAAYEVAHDRTSKAEFEAIWQMTGVR